MSRATGLSLREGLDRSGLTGLELWLLYVGLGGNAPSSELVDEIAQDNTAGTALGAYEHNLIAQALNEHFLDLHETYLVGYRESPEAD